MDKYTLARIFQIMQGKNFYTQVLHDGALWVESEKTNFTPAEIQYLTETGCVFNEYYPNRIIIPAGLMKEHNGQSNAD